MSHDKGRTWSEKAVLIEGTGVSKATDCGFGDAAIVADRESGEVLVVMVCGETVSSSSLQEERLNVIIDTNNTLIRLRKNFFIVCLFLKLQISSYSLYGFSVTPSFQIA